nr:hypothetical protein [Candidatus Magnetomorum sp.]
NSLSDIAAISNNLMIAVGDQGLIMHRNASDWIIQKSLTTENLKGIFVIDSNQVYAVGNNGSFLFYNGINWSRISRFTTQRLNAIWGTDADNLFAAGEKLLIFTHQNNLWHPIHEGIENDSEFYDVWGVSKTQVFFVGGYSSSGVIYYWDGFSVSSMIVPECPPLYCVWGTGPDNVYAAGDGHCILHYDGLKWSIMYQGDIGGDQISIRSLWGKDETTMYAVGGDNNGATILLKTGENWEQQNSPFQHWLTGISGWNDQVVAVGLLGTAVQLTLPEPSWTSMTKGQTNDLKAIWGRNANDIYAVGEYNQFKQYSNGSWQSLTLTEWHAFYGVYGNETTVYAVGADGVVLSYENNTFYTHDTGTDAFLKDVWGIDNTFFAVGENGTILCYTGTTWHQMIHPLQNQPVTLYSVWGTASDQVFVVGEQNQMEQYDGVQWISIEAPDTNSGKSIFSIWGTAPHDFYITCDEGNFFRYYQGSWIETENFGMTQYDIWGWDDRMVTVGDAGILLFDNSGWNELEKMTFNTLYGVWGIDDQIFAVGYGGTQLMVSNQPSEENHPPEIPPIADKTIYDKNSLTVSFNLIDPDGDALTVTINSKNETIIRSQDIAINGGTNQMVISSGTNMSVPLTIVCLPSGLETGTAHIEINVSDARGMTALQAFALTVATEYTVTVVIMPENSGMIYVNANICNTQCSYVFGEGETATIEAYAMPGYHFTEWAKDVTGDAAEQTLYISKNTLVAALFTENQLPDKPYAIQPENGEIIPDSTVLLIGGTFNDADNDAHYRTYWKIRVVDQPYACSEFKSMFCYQSDSTPLTAHILTDLISGYQYAWMFGYQDATDTTISWSDENFFIIGKVEKDTRLSVKKGESALDYKMVSLVQWFPTPLAGKTFGAQLRNGYNPSNIRIGKYATSYGYYVEYAPDLWTAPGMSFWVLSRLDIPMSFTGVPVTTRYPVEIQLTYGKDGWNMIACPNRASYTWEKVQIISYDKKGNSLDPNGNILTQNRAYFISEMKTSTVQWIDPSLWLWEAGKYRQTSYLDPYKGYWVKVYQSNLALRFNPEAQISSTITRQKTIEREDIESPPLPMNAFDNEVNGIGSGCFISLIEGFEHNAGKRKGKTPYEILTRQAQKKDWLELLMETYEEIQALK